MNEGSGKNLNWFWKRWFFEGGVTDMAIRSADKTTTGYNIQIENKSMKPMPVDLTVTYTDGTVEKLHKSIGVWEKGDQRITVPLVTMKNLRKIQLGSMCVPDKNPADNLFELK